MVALVFEQLITGIYNLTLRGISGELNAYLFLVGIYIVLFFIGRLFLNKKMHPKSSQFILWTAIMHVGVTLAIYFYNSEPLLLLIYPCIGSIIYMMRKRHPSARGLHLKFRITHPEFIDDRTGTCVLRAGRAGFTLLKFVRLNPPLPIKELLLYLWHEHIECNFEIQGGDNQLQYYLTIMEQGRNYDNTFKTLADRYYRLQQFFKKEGVRFLPINDILSAQCVYYAPFFIEHPLQLNAQGTPVHFPKITIDKQQLVIQRGFSEHYCTLLSLNPKFAPNQLHPFLAKQRDFFHIQIQLHPLNAQEIAQREETLNRQYRESIKRLSDGLEDNAEFQAASYLFSRVGQDSSESIKPLLDKEELGRLNHTKEEIRQLNFGCEIGLWDVTIAFLGNLVLGHALYGKLGGSNAQLPPQLGGNLTARLPLSQSTLVNSKQLSYLLPNPEVPEAPAKPVGSHLPTLPSDPEPSAMT